MNYYFLSTILPSLSFDHEVEISVDEFCYLASIYLSENDAEAIRWVRLLFDLHNMRSVWMAQKAFSSWGNYTMHELEHRVLYRFFDEPFIDDFLASYESAEERLHHFPALLHRYYRAIGERFPETLFAEYTAFSNEVRLALVALRAREGVFNLVKELSLEQETAFSLEQDDDSFIEELLAKKEERETALPSSHHLLEELYHKHADDPFALERAFLEVRFYYLEDRLQIDLFSSDRIIGYFNQLILVSSWRRLMESPQDGNMERDDWFHSPHIDQLMMPRA